MTSDRNMRHVATFRGRLTDLVTDVKDRVLDGLLTPS